MDPDRNRNATPASKADHLCVLVHGLWGNPSHMDFIAASLRERYDEDHLHILASDRNNGNLTYDGIEVCGERLAHEIEETLETFGDQGQKIRKLSVVGYSLGGLISRYALGLLYARGWLDRLEPVNFTTFASPHLGARVAVGGVHSFLFNNLGPRTVSTSGKQLFMKDTFRDYGKPLLSVLADPGSIFVQALTKFKYRSVYGNIINDRTTPLYTTIFSSVDPFRDPENVNINYVTGYEPVVVDPYVYTLPSKPKAKLPFMRRAWGEVLVFANNLKFWSIYTLVLTIAIPTFLVYAFIQTCRSQARIRIHEEGISEDPFKRYRIPIVVKKVQTVIEEVFENAASRQDPDYLTPSATRSVLEFQSETSETRSSMTLQDAETFSPTQSAEHDNKLTGRASAALPDGSSVDQQYPTLALTPDQFSIIKSLNRVGFHKYPIYIHNHRHSHAAIVVRIQKEGFEEGHTVIKHWLDCEFEL
ncbi:hypothetical protein P175DRAFT_0435146 [Aspergillus ochraceoroseus IBT 24754]|uniref:DUF676 domain-containing protein n=3 Tax=Aspergillus subgen. Nidulantes TaxID=2720870 RepID=A0A0F8UFC8_9EURO|nr:uncharacterized protein P175DRAFT_0435146 [Aspergillus ochraceoroseus IBT 24754]KKK15750.1 hypothetical protein AOCH_002806 [Aspergillus ochraceoroseus]KKK18389.1 hypothetical protein ARAM_001858 [Aspergillus rambellii]PTU21321.1 hypothetical protein P175DRAFT_0435146 [Aspergillus ochraceoroseus IBT 24754]